jgi:hypothetical protein
LIIVLRLNLFIYYRHMMQTFDPYYVDIIIDTIKTKWSAL